MTLFLRCPTNVTGICDEIRRLLNFGAYEAIVQKHLVQAQYWHDPLQENEYVKLLKADNLFNSFNS